MMKLVILTLLAMLALTGTAVAKCIRGGDQTVINAALTGVGAHALLCPRAIFEITQPIILSADGQELATEGDPADDRRAVIRVAGGDLATAISSRASDIRIHHLIVDGGRPKLGRITKGGALIEVGGATRNVTVDHVRAFDPRGWSALHVFEGAKNCTGARITDNLIGPAGTADGAWADGISFACRAGFVAHNTIIDASDGAIVIFGAPGTVVEDNAILEKTNVLLGGINMVDYAPFDGDYSGTIVKGNKIEADTGYIKVAIAIGPAVWGSQKGKINLGATIEGNRIVGDNIGYGIAVDGARSVTVIGNKVEGHLHGVPGPECRSGQAAPGLDFARNPNGSGGYFQPEFQAASLTYSICINAR